jgi:cobalamin biosynthetic protein CobC
MHENPAAEAQGSAKEINPKLIPLEFAGHGGDLGVARKAFPNAPAPWLDLSTGVNPYAYPLAALPLEAWTRLPEPESLAGLESAAAEAYGVGAGFEAVAAPGTQAIVNWLAFLAPARRVGILGFTYFEHARSWRAGGAEVAIVDDLAALADKDVAVVVNPNNPDGRRVLAPDLRALAGDLAKRGGLLVVDEAFVDFLESDASIVPNMPAAGVVVLRSFGKTYGLPGLRLGFAIAPKAAAAKLRAALGCWPVSGAAIAIGAKALADPLWRAATRAKLEADGRKLDEILADGGLASVGGVPLFRLARHDDASGRFEALAGAGIWVRRFAGRPNWLRFAIPNGDADRARLRAALGLR